MIKVRYKNEKLENSSFKKEIKKGNIKTDFLFINYQFQGLTSIQKQLPQQNTYASV